MQPFPSFASIRATQPFPTAAQRATDPTPAVPILKPAPRPRRAFTLVELLVVIGIVSILLVLLAPAFNSLKQAGDVTSAAYTIKGVLELARATAISSNTYTWVGFYEEDASAATAAPNGVPIAGNGRVVLSVVASMDGTNIYGSAISGPIDAAKLRRLGKLTKIENIHLPLFAVQPGGSGSTFDTRPTLEAEPQTPAAGYNYCRFGELNNPTPNTAPYQATFSFVMAPYTFSKLLQFSPSGEARVLALVSYPTYSLLNNVRRVIEIGLIQTHASVVPPATSGGGTSSAVYAGNAVALQLTGFSGNLNIYTR